MTRHTLAALAGGLLCFAMCAPAHAQYSGGPGYGGGAYGNGNPYGRPQLSPYLNLLRGGNPAANYYLGVIPEMDRRANAALFSTAISDLERRSLAAAGAETNLEEPINSSGHPTAFMTTGTYFGGVNAARISTPGAAAGARRPAR